MTPKQYQRTLKRYVADNFESQKDAAAWFNCSTTTMCLVLQGERTPNDSMVEATGYEAVKTTTIKYKRIGSAT